MSTLSHQSNDLGLRPVFEDLLGSKVVDNFIAEAWKRSAVGFHAKWDPPKITNAVGKKAEGTYVHGHARFDALGPVLQCPPSIFSKFGSGDEEKRICGLPTNLLGDSAGLTSSVDTSKEPCVIISIGGKNWWGFELSISKALPHCHIHTLDCTVDGMIPPQLAKQVTFHKICIGGSDENVTKPVQSRHSKRIASSIASNN
jgi:hypothetical protein